MIKTLITAFVLFFTILIDAQVTYYVSSSSGNDANSGTSENQSLKTLSKVNSLNLKPGDKVLLKEEIFGMAKI